MKCPSCGNEQADGWLSCQKCHIIFSRWQSQHQPAAGKPLPQFQAPAQPATPPPPRMFGDPPPMPPSTAAPARPGSPGARPAGWALQLALLLPFAAGLWWLLYPSGRAVEPGSYRSEPHHFAVHAPAEWVALTRENFDAIVRQYGDQLPRNITQALSGPGMAVSFVRLGQPGEFSPSLNVVVIKGSAPPINEKSKAEAAGTFAQGYKAMFPDYRQESVEIIEVDKLRSLEIVGSASFPFQFPGETEASSIRLRSRQVLVPGKKRAYIVTFTDTEDAGGDSEEIYQEMLSSFRVLKRPPRFSPVVNGGLIGGLLGGLLYLLNGLLRAFGNRHD